MARNRNNEQDANPAADNSEIHGLDVEDLSSPSGATPRVGGGRELASAPADEDENRQEGAIGSENIDKLEDVEPEPEPQLNLLPDEAFGSDGFKVANGAARDSFDSVVLGPGHVFTAPGRYYNIHNLDEVVDAVSGKRIPDGLFLIPENYLLPATIRERALARSNR